jgi:hypothetical protein
MVAHWDKNEQKLKISFVGLWVFQVLRIKID